MSVRGFGHDTGRRRRAVRLTVLASALAVLCFAPGALGMDAVVDLAAVDTMAPTETTTDGAAPPADTTVAPAEAPVGEPAPVPVVPAPVVTEPVAAEPPPPLPAEPVAVEPAAAPVVPATPVPVAVTEPTPAAPQEIIVVVQDAPAVVAGADVPTPLSAVAASAADSGFTAPADAQPSAGAPAEPLIVPTSASATAQKPNTSTSIITPLVVPIVQTLGSGLLSPYVQPDTFGPIDAAEHVARTAAARPRAVHTAPPAQATHVVADLPFGFAAPPGGWSGEGAGILALLMGFLPLGLPDGKSSLTQETQTALLLMGALLIVLPFFASPLRDRRRRGPRGFATLALRPG